MKTLNDLLEDLSKDELIELQNLIPEEIKGRVETEKELNRDNIILLYKEQNILGRNIYTIKEISELTNTKEYIVADTIKEYKNKDK